MGIPAFLLLNFVPDSQAERLPMHRQGMEYEEKHLGSLSDVT